jgi:regulator of RNase E activity RraA
VAVDAAATSAAVLGRGPESTAAVEAVAASAVAVDAAAASGAGLVGGSVTAAAASASDVGAGAVRDTAAGATLNVPICEVAPGHVVNQFGERCGQCRTMPRA